MFGSEVLEVGLGMALLFLFVSLICSALREAIEARLKMRAKDLERGIKELLDGPATNSSSTALTTAFYQNGLIGSLFSGPYESGSRNLPSYIPARQFSAAVLDMVGRGRAGAASVVKASELLTPGNLLSAAESLPDCNLKRALIAAIDNGGNDLKQIRANLEDWYDGSMDRVSGWYKRQTFGILLGLGLGSAALLNIDALHVARRLSADDTLRAAFVAEAERTVAAGAPTARSVDALRGDLARLGAPIGWPAPQRYRPPETTGGAPSRQPAIGPWLAPAILGWFITALAVTFGAPFWFDVLNKFMVVRSTVKPKEKSPAEASEDG